MSEIIVSFEYRYWGNNGSEFADRTEVFENIEQVVRDLSHTRIYSSVTPIRITRLFGVSADEVEQVKLDIGLAIEKNKTLHELNYRIARLREHVASNDKWFADLEKETARRTLAGATYLEDIAKLTAELEKLK